MIKKTTTITMLGIFLFIALVGNVNAQEKSLGSAARDDCIELIQICANCTFNNITTVYYPNRTLALGEVEMTKLGTNYNYSFCQTQALGNYIVNGLGDPDGENTIWNYDFIITPNGEIASTATSFFYIGLLLIIVVGFVGIVYFGVTKESIVVKAFALGFGYLALIAVSFLSWRMASDFLTSSAFLIDFFYYMFIVLMVGFFPFLLILFAYGSYMAITIKEIKDMIDRGIPESEAAERVRWKK